MNFSSVTIDVIQMIHGDVNDTDCCLFNNLIKRLSASGRRWSGTHAPTDVFILGNEISRFCQTSFYPKSNGGGVPHPLLPVWFFHDLPPGSKIQPAVWVQAPAGGAAPVPGLAWAEQTSLPGAGSSRRSWGLSAGIPTGTGGHRREPLPHLPGLEPQ